MPRPSRRIALSTVTALCGLSLGALPALAEDPSISSIEKQIRALQGQLNHMKAESAARGAEVRAARQEAADASRRARQLEDRQALAGYAPAGAPGLATAPTASGLAAPPQLPYRSDVHTPFANISGNPGYFQSGPGLKQGQFVLGGVRVTLGGFIEAANIFRTRNETADISSSFNTGIPYPYSANYHQPEERGSARQSRVALLIEGTPDPVTNLTAFYESDFNSAGVTSNSTESDSYTLRIRHLYAQYQRTDWDFYVLGGQTWSLATMNKTGMVPRQEDVPLVIDAQLIPGFVWTRNAQIRFVKGFDKDRFDIGLSFESPESSYYVGPNGSGLASNYTVNYQNTGLSSNGGTLNSTANYTTEYAPDTILKVTADPGYGHYEAFGIARFFHDRVETVGNGTNHTKVGGGVGGGTILPIIKNKLDFQASGLIGQGIGRYGSGQINDATLQRDGAPQPIPEWMALAGLIYRPVKSLDLYSYVGTEQVTHREAFQVGSAGYGYGSTRYNNAGCEIELSAATTCVANTSGIVQGTLGGWYRFLKGSYGTMQVGAQYSYTRRSIWSGTAANTRTQTSPDTDENIVMFSFRYLPFQ